MNKKQDGFGLVEAIVVVLIIGLMGFIAVQFVSNQNKKAEPTASQVVPHGSKETSMNNTQKVASNSTYKNEELGFSFSHPKDWINLKNEQPYKDYSVALRSPEMQAKIDTAQFEPGKEYLRQFLASADLTVRIIPAGAQDYEENIKVKRQHEQGIICPNERNLDSPEACQTGQSLINSYKKEGVFIYEVLSSGHSSNYTILFERKGYIVRMSFLSASSKEELTPAQQKLISSLQFS